MMKTIELSSIGFWEGFDAQETQTEFEGGFRQIDWDRLFEFIKKNENDIEMVKAGLAEDWDCTGATVYDFQLGFSNGFAYDRDEESAQSLHGASNWATPAIKAYYTDGSVESYECWTIGDFAGTPENWGEDYQ